MGVRLALGATPRQLLALVMSRGAILAVTGAIVGMLGAFLTTRWMQGLLYGVTPTDSVAFITAPLLLILVGLLATWVPATRVVHNSPVAALRND